MLGCYKCRQGHSLRRPLRSEAMWPMSLGLLWTPTAKRTTPSWWPFPNGNIPPLSKEYSVSTNLNKSKPCFPTHLTWCCQPKLHSVPRLHPDVCCLYRPYRIRLSHMTTARIPPAAAPSTKTVVKRIISGRYNQEDVETTWNNLLLHPWSNHKASEFH